MTSSLTTLTKRQQEVARLVADGWADKQIATELGINEETVGYHVGRIVMAWNLDRSRNVRVQIAQRVLRVA